MSQVYAGFEIPFIFFKTQMKLFTHAVPYSYLKSRGFALHRKTKRNEEKSTME